jgi:hypothetical protein
MRIVPAKPIEKLALGDERLLTLNMSEAAAHYDVAGDIVGRRLRVSVSEERGVAVAMSA